MLATQNPEETELDINLLGGTPIVNQVQPGLEQEWIWKIVP